MLSYQTNRITRTITSFEPSLTREDWAPLCALTSNQDMFVFMLGFSDFFFLKWWEAKANLLGSVYDFCRHFRHIFYLFSLNNPIELLTVFNREVRIAQRPFPLVWTNKLAGSSASNTEAVSPVNNNNYYYYYYYYYYNIIIIIIIAIITIIKTMTTLIMMIIIIQ